MGDILQFITSDKLPSSISAVFAAIVILGIVFIFSNFILRGWKLYHEFNKEKEEKIDTINDHHSMAKQEEQLDLAMKIYGKIIDLTNNHAGKYITKDEMEAFRKEILREIEKVKKDQKIIKEEFGIK
jgi:hypothetical protein